MKGKRVKYLAIFGTFFGILIFEALLLSQVLWRWYQTLTPTTSTDPISFSHPRTWIQAGAVRNSRSDRARRDGRCLSRSGPAPAT